MAISMDLRVLARKLEKSSDDLLVNASTKGPAMFEKVATAIAAASTLLEGVADDMDENAEFSVTAKQLDELAALASAFDESGDPLLMKQASVLDELLLSIAAPRNAALQSRKVTEDEVNRLREKRRSARREEAYVEPREAHADMNNAKEQAKAVAQQVKRYRPLEAPLQTRYPPDRPGGQMTRITDHVYQDIVTGIIYDFKAGYTTQKGNEVPGSSVENQTRMLGDYRNQAASLFETRDSLMSRYASDGDLHHLKKYAMANEISEALKAVRTLAPHLLDKAIDHARNDGLSTSEIGEILGDVASVEDAERYLEMYDDGQYDTDPFNETIHIQPLTQKESESEYFKAMNLLPALASAGWSDLIADQIMAMKGAGMLPEHLSDLERKFLGGTHHSMAPAPNEQDEEEMAPYSLTVLAPSIRNEATNRHGLVALALGAVQELAPHLLKAAIAKAKDDGLTDQQVKSVLAGDFNTKFKTASFGEKGEVQAAQALFPQLKALGWDDLIDSHLKVMSSLGVSPKALRKLADVDEKISSYAELHDLLSMGGVQEFAFDEEPEPVSLQPLSLVKKPESQADMPIELDIEPSVPVTQTPVVPSTTAPVAVSPTATTPEADLTYEDLFGDVEPEVEVGTDSRGYITPTGQNREKWLSASKSVQEEVFKIFKPTAVKLMAAGATTEDLQGRIRPLIDAGMNARGFAGPYEKDPATGMIYKDVAAAKPEAEQTIVVEPVVNKEPKAEVKTRKQQPKAKSKFDWDKYQEENKLDNAKIAKVEAKAEELFEEGKGNIVQALIPDLPKNIQDQVTQLFGMSAQEAHTELYSLLKKFVKQNVIQELEKAVKYKQSLIEKSQELSKKEKFKEAEKVLQQVRDLDSQIGDFEFLIKEKMGRLMPSGTKWKAAKEEFAKLEKVSINQALEIEGLPPLFSGVKPGTINGGSEGVQAEVKMSPDRLIHIPKDVKTPWADPEMYIKAIKRLSAKYPLPYYRRGDNSQREAMEKKWLDDPEIGIKALGLMNPFEQVFGRESGFGGSLSSALGGMTPRDVDNLTPTILLPNGVLGAGTPNEKKLKTLTANPEEYVKYYLSSRDKFKHVAPTPSGWDKVTGGVKATEAKDFIDQIGSKKFFAVQKAIGNGQDPTVVSLENGVPEKIVKAIEKSLKDSGHKVRGMMSGIANGVISKIRDLGNDGDVMASKVRARKEFEEKVSQYYPNANVPNGMFDELFDLLVGASEDNAKIDESWMNDAVKNGFWPLQARAIGKTSAIDLLKGR